MKKKLLILASCFLAALGSNVRAQDYQAMPIASGLNADVIANGIGPAASSTSIDIDGVNYNYISTDYQLTASSTPLTYGIPANGLINSIVPETPSLWYQLAPLSGNNSLRLEAGDVTGTIAFETPIPAINLYMLAVTGSGSGTANVVVNFDDDTSQTFNGVSIPDWFGATNPPPAIIGIGRINRNTDALEPNATNPRMYQITLAISEANQSKLIESVQVTQVPTGEEVVNVLAFSAEVYTSCPAPTDIAAASTDDGATITWELPEIIPSDGFEYYVSESSEIPGDDVTLETLDSDDVSVTVSGYDMGETYYFWIRSNCGDEEGFWRFVTFTPGQMSFVYTEGDISTNYLAAPTATSATTCPGTMSIDVPDGFEIVSVATSYNMSTASNGWKSEQRSLIACVTSGLAESTLAAGTGDQGGTQSYTRSGLEIANGLTGEVEFEMRAWRTYQGFEAPICGVTHNKVDNNTWTITITYAPLGGGCDLDEPVAADQDFCEAVTVADLSAEGEEGAEFHWYLTEDGEDELAETYEVEPGTYYVSQSVGDCESPRAEVEVTVTILPPIDPGLDNEICGGTTIADMQPGEGLSIKFYTSSEGGEPLPDDTVLETEIYYVTLNSGSCESERVEAGFIVNTTDMPEPAMVIIVCEGITVFDLDAGETEGATVNWYTEEEGGEPLEDVEVEPGTYYVSQTLNGCESERVEVELMPLPPAEPGLDNEICGGTTIADIQLDIEGLFMKFYTSSDGGEPLPEDTVLETEIYYITINTTECESERVEAGFIVINTETPEPAPNQTVCGDSATVIQLDPGVEGEAAIVWYDADDNELGPEDILVNGATYYVGTTSELCGNSELAPVTVTVNPVPADPLGNGEQEFIAGETIEDLEVDFIEGAMIQWFMLDEDVWMEVNVTDALVDGGVYYVTQTIDGCTSDYLTIIVDEILGTDNFDRANLSIYPNPASEIINVSYNGMLDKLVVNNLLGQEVMRQDATGNSTELNLSRLSQGTYLLQVHATDGSFTTVKIVKQ